MKLLGKLLILNLPIGGFMVFSSSRFLICLISFFFLAFSAPSYASQEMEPNNNSAQATGVDPLEPIYGKFEDEVDYYRVNLSSAGQVTVTLSGYPRGTKVQLGAKGFQRSMEKVIARRGNEGQPSVSITFNAQSTNGYILVSVQLADSVCGYDWCIAQLDPSGPYYTTMKSRSIPPVYNGRQVRGFAGYTVNIESGYANSPIQSQQTSSNRSINEKEPNDSLDRAQNIGESDGVNGAIESPWDYFRVKLPAIGSVTASLTGYPEGTNLQIGATGFRKNMNESIGWADSYGNNSVEYSFDAESTDGYIWINVEFADTTCGFDWCIGQLKSGGPYYVMTPSQMMPRRYRGQKVLDAPRYALTIKGERGAIYQQETPQQEEQQRRPKTKEDVVLDLFQIMIEQGTK